MGFFETEVSDFYIVMATVIVIGVIFAAGVSVIGRLYKLIRPKRHSTGQKKRRSN